MTLHTEAAGEFFPAEVTLVRLYVLVGGLDVPVQAVPLSKSLLAQVAVVRLQVFVHRLDVPLQRTVFGEALAAEVALKRP